MHLLYTFNNHHFCHVVRTPYPKHRKLSGTDLQVCASFGVNDIVTRRDLALPRAVSKGHDFLTVYPWKPDAA